MLNVLFISAQYVKDNGIVDENTDSKFILAGIRDAQEYQLQEIIGTDLLEEIQTQVQDSTLTAANTSLLNNFIIPYLLKQAESSLVFDIHYRLRNKGVMTFNSEEATSAANATISLVTKKLANDAQFLGERLRRFLLTNNLTYPLFLNGNTEGWKVRPARTAYQTGFWLGNQRKPLGGLGPLSSLNWNNWFIYDCCR